MVMSVLEVDVLDELGSRFEVPPWIRPDITVMVDWALTINCLSSLDPHSLSRKTAPDGHSNRPQHVKSQVQDNSDNYMNIHVILFDQKGNIV